MDTRPWTTFHTDSAAVTVNVALADDDSHGGGTLLAVFDGGLRAVARSEGEATVHPSTVLHAVSRLTTGVRYSLIMFFHRRPLDPPTACAEEQAAAKKACAETARSAVGSVGDARTAAMAPAAAAVSIELA